jgi:AbrB family looped-hinge helix DNA binding protein
MQTVVSTKGQVVLPSPLRRKLGIEAGDPLEAKIEGRHIVLTPTKARRYRIRTETSPQTGLPVLVAREGAPQLTSERVAEMLAAFP